MTLRLENLRSSVPEVSVNGLICILTPIIIGVRTQMRPFTDTTETELFKFLSLKVI